MSDVLHLVMRLTLGPDARNFMGNSPQIGHRGVYRDWAGGMFCSAQAATFVRELIPSLASTFSTWWPAVVSAMLRRGCY